MSLVTWLFGSDFDALLDELRLIREEGTRIREANERIATALEKIMPKGFVDPRRKEPDLYRPRTFQSEK